MSRNHVPSPRRPRRWTDDQLATAVAAQASWRGVARALGLRPSSTNNIRRHVTRLDLDTSHFAGRRRWTHQQLRAAVAAASSWGEVLRILHTADNGASRARVKGAELRLGLDVAHLTPVQAAPPASPISSSLPQLRHLRNAATAIATAWFSLRGFDTAVPIEQQPYDLLVDLPGGISRVQVKSCARKAANGRWLAKVGRRPCSLDKQAGRAPYDPDTVDYFFIVDGDGSLYFIPINVVGGRMEIVTARYQDYRVGDASSLLA